MEQRGFSHRSSEHYKLSYIGDKQPHGEGPANPKTMNPNNSLHEQSHLMALTSHWGHSVFELNGLGENVSSNQVKTSKINYMPSSNHSEQSSPGVLQNVEPPFYINPLYGQSQSLQANNSLPRHTFQYQEEKQQEHGEQKYEDCGSQRDWRPPPPHQHMSKEDTESPVFTIVGIKDETHCNVSASVEDNSNSNVLDGVKDDTFSINKKLPSSHKTENSSDSLHCKHTKLSDEQIIAKRAAQAAAQREVRRRRREKMTHEELQSKLSTLAASQREARRKQRERMTEEELRLHRTINAITQREIRRRRFSTMTEEELKTYKAREASRQRQLRHRKRLSMTEEELKTFKAKEAAASASRRARRLERECKVCLEGEELDPSPS